MEPGTEPKTTIKKHVEPGHKNYGTLVTSQLSKNQRLGNTFEELNVYEHGKTPPVAGAERKTSQNLEQLLNQGVQQFHERRKPTLLQSQSHQSFDDPQQPDLGPSFNAYESSGRPTSGYYSYASGGLPSNLDRYEEEVYNAFAAPKVIYNAFAAPKVVLNIKIKLISLSANDLRECRFKKIVVSDLKCIRQWRNGPMSNIQFSRIQDKTMIKIYV